MTLILSRLPIGCEYPLGMQYIHYTVVFLVHFNKHFAQLATFNHNSTLYNMI